MTAMVVRSVRDGEQLGHFRLVDGKLVASSGRVERLVRAGWSGKSDAELVARFDGGWSNGYIVIEPMADTDRARKFNPDQPRDDEGQWTSGLPGAKVADKLKLAGKIHLGPTDALVSSRRFKSSDSSSWALLAAEVETLGGRQIRLGVVEPDSVRHWTAGPNPTVKNKIKAIDAEIDALDEIGEENWTADQSSRYDELSDARDDLVSEHDEIGMNRTATLTPDGVAQLRAGLEEGAQRAREHTKAFTAWWDGPEGQRLQQLHDLREEELGPRWYKLPDSSPAKAAWAAKYGEEMQRLEDLAPEPDPTLAEGVISSPDGHDLVWSVAGWDDGEGGWDVKLGVRPTDPDLADGWYPGANDDAATFEPRDLKGLLAGLTEMAGGMPMRVAVRPQVRAIVRDLLREFSEAKVKRDRKGRFAKKVSAAQVSSAIDEVMAKLSELKGAGLDEDEDFDLGEALDYLKSLKQRRQDRGDDGDGDDSVDLDTQQYHNLSVSADPSDGTVMIDHDEGRFMLAAADAEEVAEFLDEFDDISIPDGTPSNEMVAEKTTSSGMIEAVLWGNGMIEVGGAGYINESDDNLLIDPGDPDDARNIADALEQMAELAAKGAAK